MGKPKTPFKQANLAEPASKIGCLEAEVIVSHGRHFMARDLTGKNWQVYGKGKKREVAVGDQLIIEPSGDNQAWVSSILPRKNLMFRSDAIRSKLFAANLDQVLLVLSASPPYSGELLGRTLVACSAAGVPLRILFNKIDLILNDDELVSELQAELTDWTDDSVPIHWCSLTEGASLALEEMQTLLTQQTTLILGQSGMGKSTLINLLVPDAQAATNEISMALNAGKHTTTHTQMHCGKNGMRLIDSPGFQAFGLNHLNMDDLFTAFPEVHQFGLRCRFDDCKHINEPQCAVKEALESGEIAANRYEFFQLMREEIEAASRHWQ